MRILVISEVFYPENFMINDLVCEWRRQGHSVEVISQYPSYPQSYVYDGYENKGESIEDWDGVKIHRFKFVEGYKTSLIKKLRNYFSFVRGAKKIVRGIGAGFDRVFVSQTGPLTVALPAVYAKRKFGRHTSIWTFDIWPDTVFSYGIPNNYLTKALLKRFVKYVYTRTDSILVSSEKFKESLSSIVPEKKITYAPNWLVACEQEKSSIRLNENEINFTFTGNVSLAQNLYNTVQGFILADIHNAVLNIVGDGSYMDELRRLVGDKTNVKLHGRIAATQVNDILKQSDILVLPLMCKSNTVGGIADTEPLKLQTYLAAEKPIFAIMRGACAQMIEDNGIGISANPNSIKEISEGFMTIISFMQDNKESIIDNTKKLRQKRYNKSLIVETINEAIQLC